MRVLKMMAVLFVFVSLPVFAQLSKADLQSIYVDYLRTEGYGPSIDSDGDVLFKVEGRSYYIIVHEDDLEYFEIYYGIDISATEEQQTVIAAANYANRSTKVAKTYISSNGTTAVIQGAIFVNEPEDFKFVFSRLLSTIKKARDDFISQL
jgi:hypothetical protein